MSLEKAKADEANKKEELKALTKNKKSLEDGIDMAKRELSLREKALELQLRNPTPTNPNFEFEKETDWALHLAEEFKLSFEKTKKQILAMIEEFEDRLERVNDELKKLNE